jgi:hypothetical protein
VTSNNSLKFQPKGRRRSKHSVYFGSSYLGSALTIFKKSLVSKEKKQPLKIPRNNKPTAKASSWFFLRNLMDAAPISFIVLFQINYNLVFSFGQL